MAYTKTQWVNNEEPSINAENLNKMEQGIADAQSSAQWGSITGQLSEQTDLNNALTELNSKLSQKVSSVNGETPDTNGNVSLNAEDIPADGVGPKNENGNPIIVTDAVAENAQNLSVDIEPIQSGSGTPSPTNIRPITGRTSVNVTSTGKNLLDNTLCTPRTNSGVTRIINSDGTITLNGTSNANPLWWRAADNMNVSMKAGTYVASVQSSDVLGIRLTFKNKGSAWFTDEFTLDEDDVLTNVCYLTTIGTVFNNVVTKPMIRLASETDATFEPYNGQTVTVQLGQTVYGGTLNVTTGVLTVETANIASYNGETIGEPWWSSMDEYVAGATPTTGAQVVYTLATPTTVSLTPAQLALLEGYNILTTDGDTITLRYTGTVASNVQSEIDEFEESTRTLAGSLAMIETSPATANHAVGDYLMLNNRFCKVTSAIATGEQIIVGSNVQYTTVAEELAAILAQINA